MKNVLRQIALTLILGIVLSRAVSALDGGGIFPNDSGPTEVDVSKYPKEIQSAYHLFLAKCSACHTIARPINSQFLELTEEEQVEAKKMDPELFKDPKIYRVEADIWKRYVKRMMSKPGCPVQGKDGKRIWEFLVYDSKVRKMGKNRAAWETHRRTLMEDFEKQHPERYKELFTAVP